LNNFGDSAGNPIRQDIGPWARLPYGATDYRLPNGQTIFLPFKFSQDGNDTVARWGCTLTSAVMIINYFSRHQGKTFQTDPGALNTWLQHHDGYDPGDILPSKQNPQYVDGAQINPPKISEYAGENGVQLAFDPPVQTPGQNESIQSFMNRTVGDLNKYMCALNPVIVTVNNSSDWIDATGKAQDNGVATWRIHDPLASSPKTLSQAYNNTYTAMDRFSSSSPQSELFITAHSPIALVLTNPQGHREGFDPTTGTTFSDTDVPVA
jgi:hypothetical protein